MEFFQKVNVIKEFLKTTFECEEVSDTYDSDHFAQTFTVNAENRIYLVTIRRNFIDDYKAGEIPIVLKKMNIRDHFNTENIKRIIIGTSDIKAKEE